MVCIGFGRFAPRPIEVRIEWADVADRVWIMPAIEENFFGGINPLLVWQIADSAFPCGAFVHSGGLEANSQFHQVEGESLSEWIEAQLIAAARATLPFVFAAYDHPEQFTRVDHAIHAFIHNPVISRASLAQGQSWMASLLRVFDCASLKGLDASVRGSYAHFGPVFGAGLAMLGLERGEAGRLFLFMCLRGWVSAGVRLGLVGPIEGQQVQARISQRLGRLADEAGRSSIGDAAQTAPLLEILQGGHDRLYSRLFQS